jgi:hypothetical protein
MSYLRIGFVPYCLLLAACGTGLRLDPTAGRVTSIDANQENLRRIEGTRGAASYRAFFQQADLHLIEERSPSEHNRFYFREGNLFHVRHEQSAPESATLSFFLTDAGAPVKAKKTAAGRAAEPSPAETAALIAEARALQNDALAKAPPTISLPLLRNR